MKKFLVATLIALSLQATAFANPIQIMGKAPVDSERFQNPVQAQLMAKRAALTDAVRNLANQTQSNKVKYRVLTVVIEDDQACAIIESVE